MLVYVGLLIFDLVFNLIFESVLVLFWNSEDKIWAKNKEQTGD